MLFLVLFVHEVASLPADAMEAVDLLVDSLAGLEVFVLLSGDSSRSWSVEEVAARLLVSTAGAARELDRFREAGLTSVSGGRHRFAPADPAVAAAAARLVDFHTSRRIDLINHVASRALQRARTTARPPRRRNG